jgi:hypothetical protein
MQFQGPPPDPKILALLEMVNKAADTFIEGIEKMTDAMSFKAITIGGELTKEQKNAILDIVMVQSTNRIQEKAPHIMEEKTITASTETVDDSFVFWLHAKNEKPAPPEKTEPFREFAPEAESATGEITVVEETLEPELHSRT